MKEIPLTQGMTATVDDEDYEGLIKRVLKVGDRVEAIGEVSGLNLKGKKGVVVKINTVTIPPVLVEFDHSFAKGHDGNIHGRCKDGHGRYGWPAEFKLIKAKKKTKKKT